MLTIPRIAITAPGPAVATASLRLPSVVTTKVGVAGQLGDVAPGVPPAPLPPPVSLATAKLATAVGAEGAFWSLQAARQAAPSRTYDSMRNRNMVPPCVRAKFRVNVTV